jgi:hypothetical protein
MVSSRGYHERLPLRGTDSQAYDFRDLPHGRLVDHFEAAMERIVHAASVVIVAVILALIGGLGYFYVQILRPLFLVHLLGSRGLLHQAASVSLLFNAAANYLLCITTNAGHPSATPAALHPPAADDPEAARLHRVSSCDDVSDGPGGVFQTRSQQWRYCVRCRALKPPRAHHDSTTNRCYLRMCHFCPAMGRVIGLRNIAFFLRFIMTSTLGCAFTAMSCAWLLNRIFADGSAATEHADYIFFCMIACVATGVAVGVLTTFHIHLLYTNQTTIECYENWTARRAKLMSNYPFDAGLRANVVAVLGRPVHRSLPWWSVVFIPELRPRYVPLSMLHPPPDLLTQLD